MLTLFPPSHPPLSVIPFVALFTTFTSTELVKYPSDMELHRKQDDTDFSHNTLIGNGCRIGMASTMLLSRATCCRDCENLYIIKPKAYGGRGHGQRGEEQPDGDAVEVGYSGGDSGEAAHGGDEYSVVERD
nr:hypothetical protein Iba_chr06aCG18230 [Ipomoea batatas]